MVNQTRVEEKNIGKVCKQTLASLAAVYSEIGGLIRL